MNELEKRLRASAAAYSAAAKDAKAPREIKRAIARHRRLKAGWIGGAVAVVIASLVVAGLGLPGLNDLTELVEPPGPSPTPTPDLTIKEGNRAYATVPLPESDGLYSRSTGMTGEEHCGGTKPEPALHRDAFTADFALPDSLELNRGSDIGMSSQTRTLATITYDGQQDLPAYSADLVALFVEDGKVVGFTQEQNLATLDTYRYHQAKNLLWNWGGWVVPCDPDVTTGELPEGDYEVVFVARVYNTLTAAAQQSLEALNYILPAANELRATAAGSYLCNTIDAWHRHRPITCNPNAIVGFELHEEDGTATLPYDTSLFTREVDVTLVSNPVQARLQGSLGQHFLLEPTNAYEWGTEVGCGDLFDDFGVGAGQLAAAWPPLSQLPQPGARIESALWRWEYDWGTAQATVPSNPRVWLMRDRYVEETYEDGGVTHTGMRHGLEVVGWLDTESHGSGSINLDVYDGPAHWPLTVTDAQWCDGYDESVFEGSMSSGTLMGLTTGPASITFNDGTAADNIPIMFSNHLDS